MAELPELALRPGYATPADLPRGDVILTTMADGRVRVDRADPRVLISAELLGAIAVEAAPGVSLTVVAAPNGTRFYHGAVLKIEGVNRTVTYRMADYIPAVNGYVGELTDGGDHGGEVDPAFRAQTGEFMDRNDELLRRLADGGDHGD